MLRLYILCNIIYDIDVASETVDSRYSIRCKSMSMTPANRDSTKSSKTQPSGRQLHNLIQFLQVSLLECCQAEEVLLLMML